MFGAFLDGSVTAYTIDAQPIVDGIQAAIPTVLPAVISILGVRKVISFILGALRSA